jgi:hypothetical protein
MKKTVYYLIFFIAVAWSCISDTDDITVQPENSFTVAMAKRWFETNGLPAHNSWTPSVRSGDVYSDLIPLFDWDLAELQEDPAWAVVELPWEYENGYVSIATSEVKDYAESHDRTEMKFIMRGWRQEVGHLQPLADVELP